ncbi:hypothetical protein LOC51_21125 [Rubrivivax sp. JA1024]|nr:hypothetical protein [Rubrivivax sp. JA1024]
MAFARLRAAGLALGPSVAVVVNDLATDLIEPVLHTFDGCRLDLGKTANRISSSEADSSVGLKLKVSIL